MKPAVGLIGCGRFGLLAARYLAGWSDVVVYDAQRARTGRLPARVRRGTMAQAASQPIVVLAVPMSSLRTALRSIRSHVKAGTLVVDVCSVKTLPVRWMKEILPPDVEILGTHPLFGPDSDTGSLTGQRIVLCPVRVSSRRLKAAKREARRLGFLFHVMTPMEHDRMMAETLLLSQYVGRLIPAAGIAPHAWSTPSYRHLAALVTIAGNDTGQIFRDMWRFNPYAGRIARRLQHAHARLLRGVRSGAR